MKSREIVTRKEAIEAGAKRYFNGKPCPQGHLTDRYVSGMSCVECAIKKALARYYRKKDGNGGVLKGADNHALDCLSYLSAGYLDHDVEKNSVPHPANKYRSAVGSVWGKPGDPIVGPHRPEDVPDGVSEEWEVGKISRKLSAEDIEALKKASATTWRISGMSVGPYKFADEPNTAAKNTPAQVKKMVLQMCTLTGNIGADSKKWRKVKAELFDQASMAGIFTEALDALEAMEQDDEVHDQ